MKPMAKRKAKKARKTAKRTKPARRAAKRVSARRSAKRPSNKGKSVRRAASSKAASTHATRKPARKLTSFPKTANAAPTKVPRLDRARRTLEDTVPTPPSSLDMERHGSAARTGRAGMAQSLREHHGMSSVTAG